MIKPGFILAVGLLLLWIGISSAVEDAAKSWEPQELRMSELLALEEPPEYVRITDAYTLWEDSYYEETEYSLGIKEVTKIYVPLVHEEGLDALQEQYVRAAQGEYIPLDYSGIRIFLSSRKDEHTKFADPENLLEASGALGPWELTGSLWHRPGFISTITQETDIQNPYPGIQASRVYHLIEGLGPGPWYSNGILWTGIALSIIGSLWLVYEIRRKTRGENWTSS